MFCCLKCKIQEGGMPKDRSVRKQTQHRVTRDDWCRVLKSIAPLELAADWDNVGLIVEGPVTRHIGTILVCVDLSEGVLTEAIEHKIDAIVAYHPPIFGGMKRLGRAVPSQNTIIRLIEEGISVWSPHTALDATAGGLGDWLLDCLGTMRERSALEPCPARPSEPMIGMGRQGRLDEPTALPILVQRVKDGLGLAQVRLATAQRHREGKMIKRVAVCPGAGASVLSKARFVDLLLTGEMRHHDVLHRVAQGTSVILTDHTHTERGYLPILARQLEDALGIQTRVSTVDDDPLVIV
jgi:dinuclear metal center YbgI/SA1388 family protein